jgi:2-haloacid dehalogenase
VCVSENCPGAAIERQKAQHVDVEALIFDTFGTVVDWRGSIIEEGRAWGRAKGVSADWARFADRWRAGYLPAMERVRKAELPWTKLDDLHR